MVEALSGIRDGDESGPALSLSSSSTRLLLEDVCNNSMRQKTLLEGQLGKAGLLRRELDSFTSHIQDALGQMQSDPSRVNVAGMMSEFKGDMERLLNYSSDTADTGLLKSQGVPGIGSGLRTSQHMKSQALSKENVDMQAFLSEVQAMVVKSACGAEESKIRMQEAEEVHRAEMKRKEVALQGLQASLLALQSENEKLHKATASADRTRETERVRSKKQIKKLEKALRDSESAAYSLQTERRELKGEVMQLRGELVKAAGIRSQLVAGHAELADALAGRPLDEAAIAEMARRCEVAETAMHALREEFSVKQEQMEVALRKALREAAQAKAEAEEMQRERDALAEQVQTASLKQEVQDLRKALERASQEARDGAEEKEELVEVARRYRAQVAALREELRNEVRLCKEQVAAAHEHAEEEGELRRGADARVEDLQEEVDQLRQEMAETIRKLEASDAELVDLRTRMGVAGSLGEQLAELRQLRVELDEKTDWLKSECAAQEKRGSAESGSPCDVPDTSSSGNATGFTEAVVYPRSSLTRELGLQREKCLELGTALAAKQAELARAWSEAQKAADIIAQLKEERHEVGSRLEASEAKVNELRESYTAVQARMASLSVAQRDKGWPCATTVQEVHINCREARWVEESHSPDFENVDGETTCSGLGLVGCDVEEPLTDRCSPAAALAAADSTPAATTGSPTASPDSTHVTLGNAGVTILPSDAKVQKVDDLVGGQITVTKNEHNSLPQRHSLGDSALEASNSVGPEARPFLPSRRGSSDDAVELALHAAQRHRSDFPAAAAASPASPAWRGGSSALTSEIEALKRKAGGGVRGTAPSSPAPPKPAAKRGESPYKALLDSIGRSSSAARQATEVPSFSLGKK